jgi:hypothetical protein
VYSLKAWGFINPHDVNYDWMGAKCAASRIADQLHKCPKRLKTRLMDVMQGAVLGPGGRLVFVIIMMFVGYKLVIVCSKSAYLQDYMASLQPDSVGISSTHKLHNVDLSPQQAVPVTAMIDQVSHNQIHV